MKTTKITIEVDWEEQGDAEDAFDAAVQKIKEGYYSGFDSNDTGAYRFNITGDDDEAL